MYVKERTKNEGFLFIIIQKLLNRNELLQPNLRINSVSEMCLCTCVWSTNNNNNDNNNIMNNAQCF